MQGNLQGKELGAFKPCQFYPKGPSPCTESEQEPRSEYRTQLKDIHAFLRLIRAKGMSEGVRRRGLRNPCLLAIGLDEHLNGSLRELLTMLIQKEMLRETLRTHQQPTLERLRLAGG